MLLVDAVLRHGHLSERALTDALLTGERPAHLDRCEICSERAIGLSRWLDDVRLLGIEAADAVFPAEKLQFQHAQIMRRLEQIDQPAARVIAFPAVAVPVPITGRRVAAGWVGVAAAAGLVLGVVGGQLTARFDQAPVAPPASQAREAEAPRADPMGYTVDDLLRSDLDQISIPSLEGINQVTPRILTNAGG